MKLEDSMKSNKSIIYICIDENGSEPQFSRTEEALVLAK